MKTIGIKLADGTFYPILEEGSPKKRMLDLTTAKDNQTKVQIDLYRSETGSMEDAEYVDTLEVTKLNPHPNGEPELHLSVGLDEDNKLTAEVVDPETGKKSETEVTLVSRTLAERASPSDFEIKDEHLADTASEATFSPDELGIESNALEDMDFSFDRTDTMAAGAADITDPATDSSFADTSFDDTTAVDGTELPVEDTTLEGVDFSKNSVDDLPDFDSDFTSPADNRDSDSKLAEESVSEDSFPEFDSTSDTIAQESVSDETFPDFDATASSNSDDDSTIVKNETSDDTAVQEEDFSLPDFDDFDSTISKATSDTGTETTGLNFADLDDPSFDTSEFEIPDFDAPTEKVTDSDIDEAFAAIDTDSTQTGDTLSSSGSSMDFSDLYDKETLAGEHASLYDDDDQVKKTRVPVIICIVCAIICVLATILILFIVPSKYNLIKSRNTRNSSSEAQSLEKTETAPVPEESVVINVTPAPKEEKAPVAVEDKIVVAEKPAKVVPSPAPKTEKKPDVK